MPRWPKREEGMEKSLGARRRKPETSKTDLKPLLNVLRRTGCPSRGGIRRVCGEVPGRSRWGLPQGRTGRPKVGKRSSPHYGGEGVLIHPPHQGVCGRHGTEDLSVTPGGLPGSSGGTEGSDPISASEVGSGVLGVVGRPNQYQKRGESHATRSLATEWVGEVGRRRRLGRDRKRDEQGR